MINNENQNKIEKGIENSWNADIIDNNGNSFFIDYDQDIIYAQDIESGKDITDITDVEKDDITGIETKDKSLKCSSAKFIKKKFTGEQIDDDMIDNESENRTEGSDKRKVLEKSPKERFARFDEELGAGAIKRVYRGYDYDTGREIAWNVVNVSCMSDDAITKVQEEIAIIKKLKHPNIINFVSGFFNEEKKEVVIITEIFTSGSLKQYLNKIKHPRLKVIKFWCKEVLKGLRYLHELPNPIIHRDIKCDNIFINSTTSEIKIGDLGYSCILSNKDYAKSVSGTPEFMAPEVLEGKYGVLADIYSFGICVLELVTREKPYRECENHVIDIFGNIKNHVLPKSIEKIKNQRLLDFIKSCLKDVKERPSADELLNSMFINDLEHEENNFPALLYPRSSTNNIDLTETSIYTNTQAYSHTLLHSGVFEKNQDNNCKGLPVEDQKFVRYREGNRWSRSNKNLSPILIYKVEENIVPQFEMNNFNNKFNNNNNDTNNNFNSKFNNDSNSNNIKNNFIKKINNEIVGLRAHKSKINKDVSKEALINQNNNLNQNQSGKNFKSEHFQYQYNSSSDDVDDIPLLKGLNDKYQYDPCVVKLSDTFKPFKTTSSFLKHNSINPFSSNLKPDSVNNPSISTKIEIKIEEEYKEENAIKISLVKKEKPKHKGQKISFKFELKNDTCEKIVKELENEKIGLNEEEKKIFIQKLSNLIRNYTSSIGNRVECEKVDQVIEAKNLFGEFLNKYSKIRKEAQNILQGSISIKEEILNKNSNIKEGHREEFDDIKSEFLEKLNILEEFLKLC